MVESPIWYAKDFSYRNAWKDIAEIISLASGSDDVAVIIKRICCHSCMSARGIKKTNALTVTTYYEHLKILDLPKQTVTSIKIIIQIQKNFHKIQGESFF